MTGEQSISETAELQRSIQSFLKNNIGDSTNQTPLEIRDD